MPNRPTYPRIALPPALALRVDALRAGAPTGRPSRQAVVERALAVGLDALEGDGPDADEATVPGVVREVVYGSGVEGPGCPSLKTILFGHEPTPMDLARGLVDALPRCWRPGCGRPATRCNARVDDLTCDDCDTGYKGKPETGDLPYAAALRAFQAAAGGADGSKGVQPDADAPTGPTAPALARQVARQARAAGLDAKARAGVVTGTARALTPAEADALTAENDRRWPGATGYAGHTPDGLPPDAVTIAPRAERGERVSAEPGKPMRRRLADYGGEG